MTPAQITETVRRAKSTNPCSLGNGTDVHVPTLGAAGAVDDLAKEIDRLKAQLWKYGKHLTSCRLQGSHKRDYGTEWCDCGWTEVRQDLAPASPDQTAGEPK